MDMLRQTGRTTRMIDKVYNDYMSGSTNPLIVMANDYDVRIAQARLQWLNATVAANIIVVTYGEAAEMRVDLDTFSHPDYTVFIDHAVIEIRHAALIQHLHRWDRYLDTNR